MCQTSIAHILKGMHLQNGVWGWCICGYKVYMCWWLDGSIFWIYLWVWHTYSVLLLKTDRVGEIMGVLSYWQHHWRWIHIQYHGCTHSKSLEAKNMQLRRNEQAHWPVVNEGSYQSTYVLKQVIISHLQSGYVYWASIISPSVQIRTHTKCQKYVAEIRVRLFILIQFYLSTHFPYCIGL
jgi:hypothetical protein